MSMHEREYVLFFRSEADDERLTASGLKELFAEAIDELELQCTERSVRLTNVDGVQQGALFVTIHGGTNVMETLNDELGDEDSYVEIRVREAYEE